VNLNDPAELAVLLEGWLLVAGRPLSLEQLGELFDEAERPAPARLRDALAILARSCQGRAFELKEVSSGYRLQVRERFAPWVGRLWEERPQRYSRALLETLALIAYRQPISRGEIEEVRGVTVSSNIVKTLQERDWIRVVGHREVPGRPALFATTRTFLDDFNLKNLDELPPMAVLRTLEPALGGEAEEEVLAAAVQVPVEPEEQVSFRTLLAELDSMEEGLKTDFDDLSESSGASAGEAGVTQAADESP